MLKNKYPDFGADLYNWHNSMSDLALLECLGVANLVDIHSLFRLCSAMAADKIQKMNLD